MFTPPLEDATHDAPASPSPPPPAPPPTSRALIQYVPPPRVTAETTAATHPPLPPFTSNVVATLFTRIHFGGAWHTPVAYQFTETPATPTARQFKLVLHYRGRETPLVLIFPLLPRTYRFIPAPIASLPNGTVTPVPPLADQGAFARSLRFCAGKTYASQRARADQNPLSEFYFSYEEVKLYLKAYAVAPDDTERNRMLEQVILREAVRFKLKRGESWILENIAYYASYLCTSEVVYQQRDQVWQKYIEDLLTLLKQGELDKAYQIYSESHPPTRLARYAHPHLGVAFYAFDALFTLLAKQIHDGVNWHGVRIRYADAIFLHVARSLKLLGQADLAMQTEACAIQPLEAYFRVHCLYDEGYNITRGALFEDENNVNTVPPIGAETFDVERLLTACAGAFFLYPPSATVSTVEQKDDHPRQDDATTAAAASSSDNDPCLVGKGPTLEAVTPPHTPRRP